MRSLRGSLRWALQCLCVSFLAQPLSAAASAPVLEFVRRGDTWTGSDIRSPDCAGVAYHPPSGHLFISDSELSEYGTQTDGNGDLIYEGKNVFEVPPDVSGLVDSHYAPPYAGAPLTEPDGIAYHPLDGHFYVTDDDRHAIYRYTFNAIDGKFGDPVAAGSVSGDGSDDPEGISIDPHTGVMWVVDGESALVLAYTFDDVLDTFVYRGQFSVAAHVTNPEGIAFDAVSGHLFLVSDADNALVECTTNGVFVREYALDQLLDGTGAVLVDPQGLCFGPTSDPDDCPQYDSLYIADGGVDNNAGGNTLDGAIVELRFQRDGEAPGIANMAESNVVTAAYADLHGYLTATGGGPAHVTIHWGETDGASDTNGWDHAAPLGERSVGDFATRVSISDNEQYWYRCRAVSTNASGCVGEAWSPQSVMFGHVSDAGVPFRETFEANLPSMAGKPGPLKYQHGWMVDPIDGAFVQTDQSHGGYQAATVRQGEVFRSFGGACTGVWIDAHIQMIPSGFVPHTITAPVAAAFWIDESCNLSAYDGTTAVTVTDVSVPTGTWVRVVTYLDYTSKRWSLWLDGARVIEDFRFHSLDVAAFTRFTVRAASDNLLSHLDDISVDVVEPPDPGSSPGGMLLLIR